MRTLFLHGRRHDSLATSGRLKLRIFAECSAAHLKRWALVYVGLAALALWLQAHYAIGLNASPSLPHRLFLIHKGKRPGRGDFVAFRWAGGGPYPAGVVFIKVLAGVPGDEVMHDREGFHVNGVAAGRPKSVSRQGQALEPGPTGRLPEGRYYVQAEHPDSLDSRYRLTGWIEASQIIGRARAIF
jgi:conjugal transfer pilin signal peptidase TrbI